MKEQSLPQLLQKIFVEECFGVPNTDNDYLGIQHGIRLIKIDDPLRNLFSKYQLDEEGWLRPDNLSSETGFLHQENTPHWDIKTDGTVIMHFSGPMTVHFYQVETLNEEERKALKLSKERADSEQVKRKEALGLLKEKLIIKMPSLNYLFSGDLEINHAIHLKQIKRGMHMDMPFKPGYGNVGWVLNKVLSWGGCIGWDISLDGKIVCCRVNYDDYINYEIQLLSAEEVETYKKQYEHSDQLMINRLKTIKEMFEQNLISEQEFLSKKQEIINAI